jgi:hypothetical protein
MYIGSLPAYQASGVRPRDEFTADGTQICFPLSQSVPGSFESGVTIVLDNVPQQPVEAFTVVDTKTLTFTAVTGTFTKNETVTGGTSTATGTVLKVNLGSIVVRGLTGTFTNGETITGGSSSASGTSSVVSTNTGSGILFSEIPASGAFLYVVHEGNATYDLIPSAASVGPSQLSDNLRNFTVDTFTGDGSTVAFTLTDTPSSANAILVMVDGIVQTKTTNYTLATNVVTFTGAPDSSAAITVIHLGFSTISRTGLVDGSVTTAKIADGSITAAKLTTGKPSWDSSGNLGIGVTPVTSKGQLQVGNIGYTDTGILAGFSSSVAGYNQIVLQNTNSGSTASTNFNVSNNNGTTTTNYGEFGINSSGFTGSGSFSQAGYTYLASASTDLAIGTYGSNAIHFVVNSSATDAMTIDASSQVGIGRTPATWSTSKAIEIGLAGSISGQTGAKTTEIATNANLNSGWKYLTSGDKATLYYQYAGAHTFNATTATGSSGTGITWDAGTTINPYGVGVGGAIPSSGIGIAFPATQVASSDANTLDDYEEGTWTPVFNNFGGTTGWTFTNCNYIKIGRHVFINCQITPGSATLTATQNSGLISGIPFSVTGPNSPVAWATNYIETLGTGVIYGTSGVYSPTISVTNSKTIFFAGSYITTA